MKLHPRSSFEIALALTALAFYSTVIQPIQAAASIDYLTELFDANDNDLDNQMFTFTPDGSTNFYSVGHEVIYTFPTDPSGGTTLSLGDDSYAQVTLSGGAQVSLYGTSNSSLFVGSNGYITFGSGDMRWEESLSDHFNLPRISALFDDLYPPGGGTVSVKQLTDRVAVTWLNIAEFGTSDQNTFQIELFFDGRIRISYLTIAATDGLVGLSRGTGVPADFIESDFTGYSLRVPAPPFAPSGLTATPVSSSQIDLSWRDNSFNEDGFKIERAPDAGNSPGTWVQIAIVGTNVTTYSDMEVATNMPNWYRYGRITRLATRPIAY